VERDSLALIVQFLRAPTIVCPEVNASTTLVFVQLVGHTLTAPLRSVHLTATSTGTATMALAFAIPFSTDLTAPSPCASETVQTTDFA